VKSSHGELITKVKKCDSELVTCDEFTGSRKDRSTKGHSWLPASIHYVFSSAKIKLG